MSDGRGNINCNGCTLCADCRNCNQCQSTFPFIQPPFIQPQTSAVHCADSKVLYAGTWCTRCTSCDG